MICFNPMSGERIKVYFTCAPNAGAKRFLSEENTIWASDKSPLWSFGEQLYVLRLRKEEKFQTEYTRFNPYSTPAWGEIEYGEGKAISITKHFIEEIDEVPARWCKEMREAGMPFAKYASFREAYLDYIISK